MVVSCIGRVAGCIAIIYEGCRVMEDDNGDIVADDKHNKIWKPPEKPTPTVDADAALAFLTRKLRSTMHKHPPDPLHPYVDRLMPDRRRLFVAGETLLDRAETAIVDALVECIRLGRELQAEVIPLSINVLKNDVETANLTDDEIGQYKSTADVLMTEYHNNAGNDDDKLLQFIKPVGMLVMRLADSLCRYNSDSIYEMVSETVGAAANIEGLVLR